ncbi:TonB-dependent receptor plug domain-containing protein [Sulfurimonas sp.]
MKIFYTVILKFIILFFLSVSAFANQSMELLLDEFKEASDLSKITKIESAGFLDVYTRDELESMQAHTLVDVLRTVPGLILTKTRDNIYTFEKPGSTYMQYSNIRLYINDHELTASSSDAMMLWFETPIEYIDHIEIYKVTSSVEFSSEAAPVVIKMYTKKPSREVGGKIRLTAADNQGYDMNIYHANNYDNGFSYFVFANGDNSKEDTYTKTFNNKTYEINGDKRAENLFANFLYNGWSLELNNYAKHSNAMLGIGDNATPKGSYIDSKQFYIHIKKLFDKTLRLEISYDALDITRHYNDENGITIDQNTTGQFLDTTTNNKIFTLTLDKWFVLNRHNILFGGFYKNKANYEKIRLLDTVATTNLFKSLNYTVNIYSLYLEDKYKYDDSFEFISSFKGEFYRYATKQNQYDNEYITRVGAIKQMQAVQFKVLFTYMVSESKDDRDILPLITQPTNLSKQYDDSYNYGLGMKIKQQRDEYEIIFSGFSSSHDGSNSIATLSYDNTYSLVESSYYERLELKYKHTFDVKNSLHISYFTELNGNNLHLSPQNCINMRAYNKYKNIDIYNELLYRGAYEKYAQRVGESYEYSFALKYHVSKDLSFGVKGNNVFDSGFKEVYNSTDDPTFVAKQRFWINMEYLY